MVLFYFLDTLFKLCKWFDIKILLVNKFADVKLFQGSRILFQIVCLFIKHYKMYLYKRREMIWFRLIILERVNINIELVVAGIKLRVVFSYTGMHVNPCNDFSANHNISCQFLYFTHPEATEFGNKLFDLPVFCIANLDYFWCSLAVSFVKF